MFPHPYSSLINHLLPSRSEASALRLRDNHYSLLIRNIQNAILEVLFFILTCISQADLHFDAIRAVMNNSTEVK